MSELIRGYAGLADKVGRKKTTIIEWVQNGCPHTLDGKVHVFDFDKVLEWVDTRESINLDDENSTGSKSDRLMQERIRKVRLEANKLEHDEKVRQGEFAPISKFEPEWESKLREIKELVIETVERIKDAAPDIPASKEQEIDNLLIQGFNKIAGE